MTYELLYTRRAVKDIKRLDNKARQRGERIGVIETRIIVREIKPTTIGSPPDFPSVP